MVFDAFAGVSAALDELHRLFSQSLRQTLQRPDGGPMLAQLLQTRNTILHGCPDLSAMFVEVFATADRHRPKEVYELLVYCVCEANVAIADWTAAVARNFVDGAMHHIEGPDLLAKLLRRATTGPTTGPMGGELQTLCIDRLSECEWAKWTFDRVVSVFVCHPGSRVGRSVGTDRCVPLHGGRGVHRAMAVRGAADWLTHRRRLCPECAVPQTRRIPSFRRPRSSRAGPSDRDEASAGARDSNGHHHAAAGLSRPSRRHRYGGRAVAIGAVPSVGSPAPAHSQRGVAVGRQLDRFLHPVRPDGRRGAADRQHRQRPVARPADSGAVHGRHRLEGIEHLRTEARWASIAPPPRRGGHAHSGIAEQAPSAEGACG